MDPTGSSSADASNNKPNIDPLNNTNESKDNFDAVFEGLNQKILLLREAGLKPFVDRHRRTMDMLETRENIGTSQHLIDFQEYVKINNGVPKAYDEWKAARIAASAEKDKLASSNDPEAATKVEVLEATIDETTNIAAAAISLFTIAKLNVRKDEREPSKTNANAIFEAVEVCSNLGDFLKSFDELGDYVVKTAEDFYQKQLLNGQPPAKALEQRILRQHKLILRHMLDLYEGAYKIKDDVLLKLAEVDNYRTANGEVDEEVYNKLLDSWFEHEKQLTHHEKTIAESAKAVLKAE